MLLSFFWVCGTAFSVFVVLHAILWTTFDAVACLLDPLLDPLLVPLLDPLVPPLLWNSVDAVLPLCCYSRRGRRRCTSRYDGGGVACGGSGKVIDVAAYALCVSMVVAVHRGGGAFLVRLLHFLEPRDFGCNTSRPPRGIGNWCRWQNPPSTIDWPRFDTDACRDCDRHDLHCRIRRIAPAPFFFLAVVFFSSWCVGVVWGFWMWIVCGCELRRRRRRRPRVECFPFCCC